MAWLTLTGNPIFLLSICSPQTPITTRILKVFVQKCVKLIIIQLQKELAYRPARQENKTEFYVNIESWTNLNQQSSKRYLAKQVLSILLIMTSLYYMTLDNKLDRSGYSSSIKALLHFKVLKENHFQKYRDNL